MNGFRDRYLVRRRNRSEASRWTNSAATRFGLLYYQQANVIRIEASADLWTNPTGKSPVHEEYVLNFNFSPLGFAGDEYLRRIEFEIRSNVVDDLHNILPRAHWTASESAAEPPANLEELLENASEETKALAREAPVFFEMYEGIYSRLFPLVEREDVYTDSSSEDYE
jgi:hypothetical protein